MRNVFKYKNSEINYLKIGNGKYPLLAFHGFGENAFSFKSIAPSLGQRYTIYAFDFAYHGGTVWNEPEFFGKKDVIEIVSLFTAANNIYRFSVLGFSMGGKCALATVEHFPERINDLFLMAADGIKTNRWFNLATYPSWGRAVFKMVINRPAILFFILKWARKMRIVSKFLYQFTVNHMNTKEKRERIYHTWMSLKDFQFDITSIKQKLNRHQIRSFLFFGKYDEVIPVKVGRFFEQGLSDCTFVEVRRGHYFVDKELNKYIEEAFEAQNESTGKDKKESR